MVIKIDYKDGKYSWQVAETENALSSSQQTDMGVATKGEATNEFEAMKLGTAAIHEIKKRREMSSSYPKVIEIL